jgi:hypothetical protein
VVLPFLLNVETCIPRPTYRHACVYTHTYFPNANNLSKHDNLGALFSLFCNAYIFYWLVSLFVQYLEIFFCDEILVCFCEILEVRV